MPPLILKRGDPSRRRDNDYDVLEDGKVVGRIFHLEAAAPEGRPWMWASGHARLRWQRSLRSGDGNSSVLTSEKTLATGSSVVAAVEPAPIPRRVLYTFADVPL